MVIDILLKAQHKALGRNEVQLLILDEEAGGECPGAAPDAFSPFTLAPLTFAGSRSRG